MRKLLINLLGSTCLLFAATVVSSQPPKPDLKPPPVKDKEAPAKSKLEQMLEIALKNNPDLHVAEAKSREADAELSRTRLAVTQKVVQLYNGIETARASVKLAETQLERFRTLHKTGAITAEVLGEAEAKLVLAKAELAKLEAEVPYLLGQQKVKGNLDAILAEMSKLRGDENKAAVEQEFLYLQQLERAYSRDRSASARALRALAEANAPAISSTMSEKIRTALDKGPMDIEIKAEWGPKDLCDWCHDAYGIEINFIFKDPALKFTKSEDAVKLKAVSFGAVLQCMEDSLPQHCFVVRDYGLILMRSDQVPPGAMRLQEFWKAKQKDKPKATEEKK